MATSNRLVFIDLLRGWAVLVMIEVHVFNAFIIPQMKDVYWFTVLNFVNGLVAPAFLFVSGFVFVIASRRKLEEYRAFKGAFWKQLGRILTIWFIGYGLHIPFYSLSKTLRETAEIGWLRFYQVDVLHCIAVGLLILFLTRIFVRDDKRYKWGLIILGLFFVLVTPLIWEIDFLKYMPALVAAYFNGLHFSMFPLFPWLGFMLLGGVCAFIYVQQGVERDPQKFWLKISQWSVAAAIVGAIALELPIKVPFVSTAVRANPLFFMERFGIVVLLLALCWYYAEKRKTEQSFVLDAGRESLLVYTAHLLLIYGTFWNEKGLSGLFGGTFSVLECVAATLGLAVLMVFFAKGWSWLKQYSKPTSRMFAYATGIVVVVLFIIRTS
ncbi:MAG: DUF1624 domain-containing protein [Ignavibacteriales bacterium]|nr:DUF1624 domain-containing protein [Ignavibacteriales bacterium]